MALRTNTVKGLWDAREPRWWSVEPCDLRIERFNVLGSQLLSQLLSLVINLQQKYSLVQFWENPCSRLSDYARGADQLCRKDWIWASSPYRCVSENCGNSKPTGFPIKWMVLASPTASEPPLCVLVGAEPCHFAHFSPTIRILVWNRFFGGSKHWEWWVKRVEFLGPLGGIPRFDDLVELGFRVGPCCRLWIGSS